MNDLTSVVNGVIAQDSEGRTRSELLKDTLIDSAAPFADLLDELKELGLKVEYEVIDITEFENGRHPKYGSFSESEPRLHYSIGEGYLKKEGHIKFWASEGKGPWGPPAGLVTEGVYAEWRVMDIAEAAARAYPNRVDDVVAIAREYYFSAIERGAEQRPGANIWTKEHLTP